MKTAIRAVLFDKDGTLFSFDATWMAYCEGMLDLLAGDDEAVKHRLADACGFDRTARSFRPGSVIVAGGSEDVLLTWARALGKGALDAVREAHGKMIHDLPQALIAGGPEALHRLRELGLVLGVVTNDEEFSARHQLTRAGILDLFDYIAGSDSGYGPKPGRGMAEGFCRQTGIDPSGIAIVGDSLHDLEFAGNAGAALKIGVLSGPAAFEDLSELASVVLPDIAHLPDFLFPHVAPLAVAE